MAVKNNPLLAAFAANLEKNYKQRLEVNSEFDMIAFVKTVHEQLGVGPGRAYRVFNAFMVNKVELAKTIHEDYGPDKKTGDKEILHTKASYAKLLRRVFGPENWQKVKIWFPLLKDFWN